jgi:predicted nucleotidyltransferase component of viral defense system
METLGMMGDSEIGWLVYPIETIIAEKLHAFVSRGANNSRSKDIYDLSLFLPKAEPQVLKKALKECFAVRDFELPENLSGHLNKIDTALLKRGWPSAVASAKDAPNFDDAFRAMIAHLKKALDE